MPTITGVTQFFPRAVEGFTTTLASTISAGAATVPLNGTAGYSIGDIVVLIVDPSTTAKQVFTGTIAAGNQVTGVVWTTGTNVTHTAGATVVDYTTATAFDMLSTGMQQQHNKNGSHSNVVADSINTSSPNGINQNALPLGTAVQIVNSTSSSVATGTTTIPFDNTIPQNTEGDQYMQATITPKAASNVLIIDVVANLGLPAVTQNTAGALFQDSTANALATANTGTTTAAAVSAVISFRYRMVAGTTSATTFKFRAGVQSSGTLTFNGINGSAFFGGTYASSITVTEYKA